MQNRDLKNIITAQKHIQGFLAKRNYSIRQLTKQEQSSYKTLAVGNDPVITIPDKYKEPKEKIVVIATSGLRCLSIACQISHSDSIPKIILIDNSKEVIQFWVKIRSLAGDNNSKITQQEFLAQLQDFLESDEGKKLHIAFPKNHVITGVRADVNYPKQDVIAYMSDLFATYGYEFVLNMIRHVSLIKQSWEDRNTFEKIANINKFHGNTKVYVYPSNIVADVDEELRDKILENIQLVEPVSIHTDLCKKHHVPESIHFFEKNANSKDIQNAIEQTSSECRRAQMKLMGF